MALKISKSEILLMRELCKGERRLPQLSGNLGMKKSFLSRVLSGLKEKGLVCVERRERSATAMLSPASHAQIFKKLSDSRVNSRIEKWLAGAAIDMLIEATAYEGKADSGLLTRESGCSKPTVYKTTRKLLGAGVAIKENGKLAITDTLTTDFAKAYADNLLFWIQGRAKGCNVSIRAGKEAVVRTDAKQVPDFFVQTGLSALSREGLDVNIASWSDFYFNLEEKKRELSLEEKFIHAILLASLPQHVADLELLALFYAKKMGDMHLQALKAFAAKYMVESDFEEIRKKAEFHKKAEGLL
jgi:predicted transcriptional regulator